MVNPPSPPSEVADSALTAHEESAENAHSHAGNHEPKAQGHGRHVEPTLLSVVSGLLWTARPHQWVKNLVVLAPIVFAKEIFVPWLMVRAVGCFAVFCVLAAAVYTMNDLADVEADRLHPRKRHRPIAAGLVPEGAAKIFAGCLVAVGLFGAALFSVPFLITVASYFAVNVAYSLKLKHWPYLDVGIIAAGFVCAFWLVVSVPTLPFRHTYSCAPRLAHCSWGSVSVATSSADCCLAKRVASNARYWRRTACVASTLRCG